MSSCYGIWERKIYVLFWQYILSLHKPSISIIDLLGISKSINWGLLPHFLIHHLKKTHNTHLNPKNFPSSAIIPKSSLILIAWATLEQLIVIVHTYNNTSLDKSLKQEGLRVCIDVFMSYYVFSFLITSNLDFFFEFVFWVFLFVICLKHIFLAHNHYCIVCGWYITIW